MRMQLSVSEIEKKKEERIKKAESFLCSALQLSLDRIENLRTVIPCVASSLYIYIAIELV